ncbi:MAG: Fe-S cluster assembly protein SufD [Rhodospirillales bacterium]
MSAIAQTGAAGFLACFDALKDALPGDPIVRQRAAASFRALGLPGGTSARRAEAWKYTSLRPVAETAFMTPVAHGLSIDLSASTATCSRFAATPDFGALPRPDRDPMVALNTMLAEDGAILHVPAETDAGLVRIESHGNGPTAFHPRHAIHLEAGATLIVLETATGNGSYLHNAVTEITIGAGAHLTHIRLQDESPDSFHFATIYADVAEGGTYDGFSLVLGARIARTEIHARLVGENGVAHMNGVQLLTGNQHADFSSVVRHDAPHGTSRQTVKNVLAGRSRGVFQGRIEVARHAQKTDGYQMNQALLISQDAEIDSKPELEIFADDVKCSHGATVGELDAEQLFYLRSRGVPDSEARAMLVRAFLTEALDLVTNEPIRDVLGQRIDAWWERQAA